MAPQRVKVASKGDVPAGSMKQVVFAGKDDDAVHVLLSNVKGTMYATSAKCTHYGAPLANGALTPDGSVLCPWHGAKFSCKTGDVEDAPALDGLLTFPIETEGEDIYVTADAEALKGKPGVAPACAGGVEKVKTEEKGTVIVGSGSAAIHLIESARKEGYLGKLTVLTAEAYAPIDRPKLSKGQIEDVDAVLWRTKSHLQHKLGVDLRENSPVKLVDVKAKSVTLESGEQIEYDTLVLATGGTPVRLPLPGADASNVLTLRGISDVAAINAALGKDGDKDLVVVGSSFIGMELAIAAASNKKAKSVSVIGMESVPLERVLGKEVGQGLQQAQEEKNGIKFYMEAKTERIEVGSDGKTAEAVSLKDKDGKDVKLPAGVVVLGVGVRPATQYLKESEGFPELLKDGSVAVDASLRVKGLSDVYALGDIATAPTKSQKDSTRIEHWNVAGNHGRLVGKILAGKVGADQGASVTAPPFFWSALGSQLRYVGSGERPGFDDVFVEGKPAELSFAAYYARGDEVVAVATMGRDPLAVVASELFRTSKFPPLAEIKAGKKLTQTDLTKL
ncbi:Apoptosis-inducing factor 1 [Tilletia horrida]|uniref:Apoptosis-inducing factor 1 n=1 Tax=Tilletia horrida TaxID=155126 RepID=A0AAN6JR67_9BASI|nr:Apoptosis-inducing factor 1 [Tilletia horrida]KAK0560914.1 Apoptosis-inducing factor 1 [Tilletia horrida]